MAPSYAKLTIANKTQRLGTPAHDARIVPNFGAKVKG